MLAGVARSTTPVSLNKWPHKWPLSLPSESLNKTGGVTHIGVSRLVDLSVVPEVCGSHFGWNSRVHRPCIERCSPDVG